MNEPALFVPFPKLARFNRDVVISEKIDGTNAQVYIDDDVVLAGSRTRWVYPGKQDNFGFAAWVAERADDLRVALGNGRHYGEWYGQGIQRGYGLDHKRFALFNTHKWHHNDPPMHCSVVPVLFRWTSDDLSRDIECCLGRLRDYGSYAVPGFYKPEGIVIFHTASSTSYKITLENDEKPKSMVTS